MFLRGKRKTLKNQHWEMYFHCLFKVHFIGLLLFLADLSRINYVHVAHNNKSF